MDTNRTRIAVIGMSGRFPGAKSLDEFWKNLISGKDTIRHFTEEELEKFEYDFDNLKNNPDFVKARGILEDIELFDSGFFGMTPKEAAETDPQHRIWLETAWHAFENAGCDPLNYDGSVGVFAGAYLSTYLLNNVLRDPGKLENFIRLRSSESYQILTGNDPSFIATKTAYKFNLRGPAIYVQTACSTSLVAISQACQSLYSYESDVCLAGGVCVTIPQESGYIFQEGSIPSPDGYCRPFDAGAKGTVPSNGVGVVVLKREEDAIRDGDRIYALVSGWALNNDGSSKVSYTAPSVEGQAEVISMAQMFAEVKPEDISYIEAHGTATQLGDPVEIEALKKAFFRDTDKKQFCGIGSVKSNIGHTDAAAGVASFIKTCLAAYNRIIPPVIHFSKPNEHIDFENSPFFVQDKLREWKENRPLIMGVSSFGIGGTNAHVVIEEPPVREPADHAKSEWPEIIPLSARSEYSLKKRKEDLINYIQRHPDLHIQDIAYTLWTGRNHMGYRSFLVASDTDKIISGREQFTDGVAPKVIPKIAFMFPGQGAQYVLMGKSLYNSNTLFRQILDDGFDIVRSETGKDLRAILFASQNTGQAEKKLAETDMTQPALFIIEYALSQVLNKLGIKPDYLIGHSIGEYTAACIAGVFDMPTGLQIVIKRASLMNSMPPGKMIAVRTGVEKLKSIDQSLFEISADNSTVSCTISFKSEDNEKVIELLNTHNIKHIPLNTSHAFHSADFEPMLDEFSSYVDKFDLAPPVVPFISCLTGDFISSEQATSGSYWAEQLRNPVLFRKGVSCIAENDEIVFLEAGPDTHLSTLVRQNKNIENKNLIIQTFGKKDDTQESHKIMYAIGRLFLVGATVYTESFYKDRKLRKIDLPVYPFDKKRYWLDSERNETAIIQQSHIRDSVGSGAKEEDEGVKSDLDVKTDVRERITDKVSLIWKSVIGLEEIDPDDDFFELGGHSLLALQIIARLKEDLNQDISLKIFMENPTIKKLCLKLDQGVSYPVPKKDHFRDINLKNVQLSFNQKRIWVISRLNGQSPAYNIPFTYHFTGNLNVEIFCKSLDILFKRHFVIFSVFKEKEGAPYCEIVPHDVNVHFLDFSDVPPEISREKIYSFASEDSRKPFNLETGPLYRLYLIKQNESSFYFHATIHHMVFDGWSWSIFIHDLKAIYESLYYDHELKLDKVRDSYLDYFSTLGKDDFIPDEGALKQFWTKSMQGSPPVMKFPYDNLRKKIPSGYGGKEDITISAGDTKKLKQVSKEEKATLFVTLLSALGVTFHRYCGEDNICIGTPIAYRPVTKYENIFGMFVNTVPLKLTIERKLFFRDLINHSKHVLLDAILHQGLPFEKIVEAINPERQGNVNPLFQVAFVWINNANMPMVLPEAKGEHVTVKEGVSPFDITFYLWENDDHIVGEIEYNTDILKRDTILKLRDNFLTLIGNLVDNPDKPVDVIPMLSDDERKLIQKFNATKTDYPKNKNIVQLFEEQVELYPNKRAIIYKGRSYTYKQLNKKSSQLACTLTDLGVKENTPVGLLTDKSLEMIVGMLGILKAGGGYVPVDPEYPEERINFMLKDSGCNIVLTREKFMEGTNEAWIKKVNLDASSSYHRMKGKPALKITSDDLAYIMYTSGTTGMPKGCMIRQQSVVRLVRNTNYIEITPEDRILLTGAIVFDATTFEIWGALLNGGSLYIVEKETLLSPEELGEELRKNNITVMWLTSPLFTQIAEIRTDIFGKLKYLLVGGDVLSPPHINKVRKDNPGLKVINGYGPTENTTFSTTYLVGKDFENSIPIGKPISNSTAYIFDKNMNYQPVGVRGELYVGGDGLSVGYLNREELNKKSFVKNPHNPAEMLYRTGDYARWLSDGNIEFMGRIDNQIKIRGFRVELEEIESVLTEIEGVFEAVVKPFKQDDEETRLAAFLHVHESFGTDEKKLNRLIKDKLPSYMMPSAYKLMYEFPKTINGKIDRDALVIDNKNLTERETHISENRTETEEIIYNIWCEALKTKNITTVDNFFDIGGNSLMAISVFSKIESAFQIKPGLRVFFDGPTIKDLAEMIDMTTKVKKIENTGKDYSSKSNILSGEL